MSKPKIPHIGLRKVKSLISLCVAFVVWQLMRLIIPYDLNVHPLFAYIYAIIEIRETPEKTKQFSLYRIKVTLIGLVIGLALLPVSVYLGNMIPNEMLSALADIGLILIGTLVSISTAELWNCKNFCGLAAAIFIICMVRDRNADTNIYLYAILRVVQTFVGIFAAWLVNTYFFRNHHKEDA